MSLPLVSTYLTASIASAMLDTPVMVLPAQVRNSMSATLVSLLSHCTSGMLCYSEKYSHDSKSRCSAIWQILVFVV